MSKKPQTGKSARPESRAKSGSRDALADVLDGLDEETLARVRDALRAQTETAADEGDPLSLFDEFLRRIESLPGRTAEDDDAFFNELVGTLTELAIDDTGGNPDSREIRTLVYARLEDRIASGRLGAASLMLVGKVLSDSGWSVPDLLKSRLVELIETSGVTALEHGPLELKTALDEIVRASGGDAFAAYGAVNSVLAAFPSDAAARMVATLGEGRSPVLLHVLAGFAMHREARLAYSAIDALKLAGKSGSVESALVERLVRMRPWLSGDRQAPLDEAIRTLRASAEAPVHADRPSPVRCYVMACDGSGAGGALATLKAEDGWRFVAAMTKPAGVEEVLSLEGLGKREIDVTLRGMSESVLTAKTDVAGVGRYLELALGDNIASHKPPPFGLIGLVEHLCLGPIAPRLVSASDLLEEILADWPDTQTNAAAVARAHQDVIAAPEPPWFEAGESVERLLQPIRGSKARAKAVLTDYLPQRREFWSRACARTAFALALEPRMHRARALSLALVGREIAKGARLDEIPLMRRIAEMTVSAYESRRSA